MATLPSPALYPAPAGVYPSLLDPVPTDAVFHLVDPGVSTGFVRVDEDDPLPGFVKV